MEMTHGVVGQRGSKAAADAGSSLLRVHVVQTGTNYCARVDDVQAYGDVNREVSVEGCAECSAPAVIVPHATAGQGTVFQGIWSACVLCRLRTPIWPCTFRGCDQPSMTTSLPPARLLETRPLLQQHALWARMACLGTRAASSVQSWATTSSE